MYHTKQDIVNELIGTADALVEALNTNDVVTINMNIKHIKMIAKLLGDNYNVELIKTWDDSVDELNNLMK